MIGWVAIQTRFLWFFLEKQALVLPNKEMLPIFQGLILKVYKFGRKLECKPEIC